MAAERWERHAGTGDVAVLVVPAVTTGDRLFDIDVVFAVQAGTTGVRPSFGLVIEIDGAREWARRSDAPAIGGADSLEYHCRRVVPAGRPMRIRAVSQAAGVRRLRLSVTAEGAAD